MADSRTFRNNNGSSFLGEEQLSWLKKSLSSSSASFKIIIISSQVNNTANGHESYQNFPKERASLVNYIMSNEIPGVIFFSGDRHHSEVLIENNNYRYPMYDVTCSSLSSPRPKFRKWGAERKNDLRLPGSLITKHNYGYASVSGGEGNKTLNLSFKNENGKNIFSFSLSMSDLGY